MGHLDADFSHIQAIIVRMMLFMESSPVFQTPNTAVPPTPASQRPLLFRLVVFPLIFRLSPLPNINLPFGDFLFPWGSLFQSETHWVVCIFCHLGFCPLDNCRGPSPTKNWYNSLVIDNSCKAGFHDSYADLDSQDFTLPTLVLVSAFLESLIEVFGKKFMKDNAKQAPAVCKQQNITIGEYNLQCKSLVYLFVGVEDSHIKKYVQCLNPRIIHKAMNKK